MTLKSVGYRGYRRGHGIYGVLDLGIKGLGVP